MITVATSSDHIARFLQNYVERSHVGDGRGIVIAGGGGRWTATTYVNVRMLRRLGCQLPIEVWYLGPAERDDLLFAELRELEANCVDATAIDATTPAPTPNHGWQLKPFAIYHSRFRDVLFLDSDNMAVRHPEYLFDSDGYRADGAIFWPDYWRTSRERTFWRVMGIEFTPDREFESGQVLVDKARCDRALALTMWLCHHGPDFYWKHCYGDKECFRAAWLRLGQPFFMPERGVGCLSDIAMAQHDSQGERVFQHRNIEKWSFGPNRLIPDFLYQQECLEDIAHLRRTMLRKKYQLTDEDSASSARLAGIDWRYTRCGHDHREMSFGDGLEIVSGNGGLEQVYFVKDDAIHICDGNLNVTARLWPTSGFYAGRWRVFERMPVVLEPLRSRRVQLGRTGETTTHTV